MTLRSAIVVTTLCLQAGVVFAQRNHITAAIENNRRVTLTGHVHPRAEAANDVGPMDPSEVLSSVTLVLQQSPQQQQDLEQLLAEQQDPASPNYHKWLTPEQYADRFGVSASDIAKITAWLEQQNLHVTNVARASNAVSFSGTVGDLQAAFRTEFHHYLVDGEQHFANATDPSIPAALQGAVRAIHGLNDFRLKPKAKLQRMLDGTSPQPRYNSTSGDHYLSPDDLAVIYGIKRLHDAGLTGSGQTIAVAGQTRIALTDLDQFRAKFNMPAGDPDTLLVPNTRDPGTKSGDLGEADLDLEWAGAVAPDAHLVYVYSSDVMTAAQYIIDQNLAPVLSVSYGLCETLTARSDASAMQSWARQANAQGITWVNAAGDSGGADCYDGASSSGAGLSVDIPASIPEVTGIGGTTLNEGSGQYWASSNGINGGSALSYIPETTWNDSAPQDPAAGGGGASVMFAKPSWQTGAGVPSDGARDVPDLSFASSADHDGYMVYTKGKLSVFGGTSAATPSFAGMIALLNQYLISTGAQSSAGVGNVNPRLYTLAQTTPGVVHDVTTGNNIVTVTCGARARNCSAGSYGFNAGSGYDQATGLGSVDAYNLVMAWRDQAGAVTRGSAAVSLTANSTSIAPGGSVTLTATVTGMNGGAPLGTVAFSLGAVSLGSAQLNASGGGATASITVNASQLQSGGNTVTAQYSGNDSYSAATASIVINLAAVSSGPPAITSAANGASFRQAFAPGMILSIFGSQLSPSTLSAGNVPLPVQLGGVSVAINGVAAPLYYVSPSQLNVQVPYETVVNQTAVVQVNNNGSTATTSLPMSAVAPGVFVDATGGLVPANSAARGQVITLYMTGDGAVSPRIATGYAPASGTPIAQLPAPVQAAVVTIGNVVAPIQFIGVPAGLVGVTQINVRVASGTPTGVQPVVVTMGATASVPAQLTVN
jgi:uncharacterized protein (TIGR03437 family)